MTGSASSPVDRGEGKASSAADLVASVVRPEIRALSPYVVAKAEGMVKLDAMENPYALPGPVRARLDAALSHVAVNRYPDGGADAAKAALRRALGISDRQAVLLGNGSDELIQIITSALARPGAVMLAPEPSFVMYSMNALYAGMRFVGVGVLLGLIGIFACTRLLQSLLFGIGATDLGTMFAVTTILTAVAFLACLLPARRASRVDPITALRQE